MSLKSLSHHVFGSILAVYLLGCAAGGPRKQQTYLEAIDLVRRLEGESALEALESACSQNSAAACQRLGKKVPTGALPILQGATTDSGTELILLLEPNQRPQFFFWDVTRNALIEPFSISSVPLPLNQGEVVRLRYEGLVLGNNYLLQVVGASGDLIDGRKLRTLDLQKRQARFAVASCMQDEHPLQNQMWSELLSHEPELILLIGDNVYADSTMPKGTPAPPDTLWKRYLENRKALSLYRVPQLVPVLAVWDDHDFGQNDADRTYPYRMDALKVFRTFFGEAEFPGVFDRGPGVSSRLAAFGQRFFLLDDRTYRSPPAEKKLQTHFGVDQEAWLFTDLATGQPAWLISGDQFFGAYHRYESYEGRHLESFQRFLKRLRTQRSPVLFVSGDRHLAELQEIQPEVLGYKTYELTTSSIHADVYPNPWLAEPNPRQLHGAFGVNNYALIESEIGETFRVHFKVYGPDKKRLFSQSAELPLSL